MQQAQQIVLYRNNGLSAGLSYYAPGQRMRRHSHGYHQVSWLLTGEMLEAGGRRERDVYRFSCGIKPADFRHENRYGPAGSLILAVNIDPERWPEDQQVALKRWQWQTPKSPHTQTQVTQLLKMLADPDEVSEAVIWDLLALAADGADVATEQGSQRPPRWLTGLRDQLRESGDNEDMAQLARNAGVHRVHLSRCFARWFGTSPSIYRSRCTLARAVAQLASGQSISQAALTAGFADQAHFTRAARSQVGLTPGVLRRLARSTARVTSVQ